LRLFIFTHPKDPRASVMVRTANMQCLVNGHVQDRTGLVPLYTYYLRLQTSIAQN